MADKRRLVALGVPTQQAEELAKQIDEGGGAGQALTVAERAEGKADTALVDVAEAQTTADDALSGADAARAAPFIAFPSYAAALAAVATIPAGLSVISADVNGREIRWLRQSGGPCLGGGWVPAGDGEPAHFGYSSGVATHTAFLNMLTWQLMSGLSVLIPKALYIFQSPCEVVIDPGYKDVSVRCEDGAVFQGGEASAKLDGSIIRYRLGAGLTLAPFAERPLFNWTGGQLDMRYMKNSTSIPNPTRGNVDVGLNAVTDGLSIAAAVVSGGSREPAFRGGLVFGLSCYAGSSWEVAGGDSGLGGGGLGSITVRGCRFIGCRDQAVYLNGSERDDILMDGNYIYGCYSALAVKRNGRAISYTNNHIENCVFGNTSTGLDGLPGGQKVISSGNRFIRVEIPYGQSGGKDYSLDDEITEMGYAYLAGWTNGANTGIVGQRVQGVHPSEQATGSRFYGVHDLKAILNISGVNPAITSGSTFVRAFQLGSYSDGAFSQDCLNVEVKARLSNISSSGRAIGSSHQNVQIDFFAKTSGIALFETANITSFAIRNVDEATGAETVSYSAGKNPASRETRVPATGDLSIFRETFSGGSDGTTQFGVMTVRQRADGRGWLTFDMRNGTALAKVFEARGGDRFEIQDELFVYSGMRLDGPLRNNGVLCPSGTFPTGDGRVVTYSKGIIMSVV